MASDNQSAGNKVDVKFLVDRPSETDFFGSHSQVAEAVADAIGKPGATNVIGLLGGWGSGKSTVVRQIDAKLKSRASGDGVHFFTYDAWLHQNDPPRRAFLEELIGELTAANLVKSADWEPRLADLAGRIEETVTQTTRSLSKTGRWIFLALGLVPLGLGFLDFDLIEKAFGPTREALPRWLFGLSLLLLLAPVLVVAGFYAWWRPYGAAWKSDGLRLFFTSRFWMTHDQKHSDESILSLLTNQTTEFSENRTKISPEPTAIEFRSVFNDLLRALNFGDRKLVIVIDNLDRLAEHEAMQLWATIRSLFLGNNRAFDGAGGLKPPTIILPIDEAAIVRMFASTQSSQQEAERLAESFNEKTFDITFHVNEPVMSDWREYLKGSLKSAFGDFVTDDCAYWITKIVEEANAQKAIDGKITPRKIIKIINSIGALLSQWGRAPINILTMTFYVAYRSKITSDVPAFLKGEYPRMDAAVEDWRRELVALHFGVSPEKAYQTLLSEPLNAAISNSDKETFSSLAAIPGAREVIEVLVDDLPAHPGPGGVDAAFVANAAILIGEQFGTTEIWARRTLENLAARWTIAQPPNTWREDFPVLLKHLSSSPANVAAFVAATGEKLGASISNQRPSPEIVSAFAVAVSAVRKVSADFQQAMPEIGVSLATLDLLQMVAEISPEDRHAIRSDKSTKDVVADFERILSDEVWARKLPSILRLAASPQTVIFKGPQKFDWDPLVQAANVNINGNNITHISTGPSLDVLGLLYTKHANAKAFADAHFDSGRLSTLLNEADTKEDDILLADIAALMYLRGTDFAGPNGLQWEAVPPKYAEFVKNFNNSLSWYCWGDATSYVLKEQKGRTSFIAIMQEVVRDDVESNDSSGISPAILLTNFSTLEQYLGPVLFSKVLTDLSQQETFLPALRSMSLGRTFNRIIVELLKAGSVDSAKVAEMVRTKLEAIDLAGWRAAIQDGVEPKELANIYRENFGKVEPLGDDLKTALKEQLPGIVAASPEVRRTWFALCSHLSKSARATLFKNLRDVLLSGTLTNGMELADLLLKGGSAFIKEGKLFDDPDKVSRHILLPILAAEDGWEVIRRDSEFFAGVVANSSPDTRSEISAILSAESEWEAQMEVREELEKILRP